jgi:hypothetical protein
MRICATCAVEYSEPLPAVCPICADERQWIPEDGQHWTDLDELAALGHRLVVRELEPDLHGIGGEPGVGIGQLAKLVRTPAGNLLWDPTGYVDDDTAAAVRELGPVLAIAASHPHMFGVQLEWSSRLGDPPVLVAEADREWLGRIDSRVQFWSGRRDLAPGLTLHQVGGHFPGSAVALWAAGAQARGVLLSGDTVFPNPDRYSIGFLRSYPNKIPLSGAVVERLTTALERLEFDRIYGNFDNSIASDALRLLRLSADRHIGWVRGDYDHLT